jgi:hypothetical protein
MSVTPLRPNVRYYCSDCDEHFHEHERAKHEKCCPHTFCTGCGRAMAPHEDNCPMCGAPHPHPTVDDPDQTDAARTGANSNEH